MTRASAAPHGDVEAVIQGAGSGTRLGLGPKAFLTLAGRTLLERAVDTMLSVAERVVVAVPGTHVGVARKLVDAPRVTVVAGGASRADTLRLLVDRSSARWLILHEVVRPFVTAALAQAVIDAARGTGAAAAVLPNADFLYALDGTLCARPQAVVAIQKPVAFARASMIEAFAAEDRLGRIDEASAMQLLALAGVRVASVPGSAMNFKLTTIDDYQLAQHVARGEA